MNRRTVIRLAAAGVLPAADGLVRLASAQDDYTPEFFSPAELEALDVLTEVIIPADDHSPGAGAAKVARFIDITAADAPEAVQRRWREGLGAVENLAQERFRSALVACDDAQRNAIVAEMARREGHPTNALERFFAVLKRATIDGYYTSKIGLLDDLKYAGNKALGGFPGCPHPDEHA